MSKYTIINGQFYEIPGNELRHYGVKGMKWGVRRDTRILANHRRNKAVRNAKDDYKSGKINAEQRNARIRKANYQKKKYMSDVKNAYKNTKTKEERDRLGKKITDMTTKEVPNVKIKRGMAAVNTIFGIGATVATAATGLGVVKRLLLVLSKVLL